MPVLVPVAPTPSSDWPATAPEWQVEISGLVLGAATAYQIREDGIDGLDLPGLRTSDRPRPQDHGSFFGSDYLQPRKVRFSLSVLGDSPGGTLLLLDALGAVWQPIPAEEGTRPLTLRLPGIPARVLFGRPRRRADDLSQLRAGHARVTLEYEAADPRVYSAAETVVGATVPILIGGLSWPLDWPADWGSGTAGVGQATNEGNFPSRPVVTFTGPLAGIRLQNATAGRTFRMSDAFALATGETLIVDFDARTVLLNGTANRYGDVATDSEWWELAPGLNEIRLYALSGTGTASVRYRSAWI